MAAEVTLKQCYNKGCGKKYSEDEDSEDVCVHHPGVPVFHDAMKGWSCCKKRSTDFTEFLNIPGCTKGHHNPVKPPEPVKPESQPLKPGEEIVVKAPLPPTPKQVTERPPDDLPVEKLKVNVGNSLKTLLTRLRQREEEKAKDRDTKTEEVDEGGIKLGTKCTNYGCDEIYLGPESDVTLCQHHPGVAIFHDGYKFWSCCQKRTSDFNEFQRQEGCTTGDHIWIKPEKKNQPCRYDWHQTLNTVVISIYAKACVPELCSFEANATNLLLKISHDNGKCEYSMELKLYGVIDPTKSSVELLGTKAEIKLRKAESFSWVDLQLRETKQAK